MNWDPRNNPQPGNVLRKQERTRTVLRRDGGNVYYSMNGKPERCCWITTWQDWACDAAPVHDSMTPEQHAQAEAEGTELLIAALKERNAELEADRQRLALEVARIATARYFDIGILPDFLNCRDNPDLQKMPAFKMINAILSAFDAAMEAQP